MRFQEIKKVSNHLKKGLLELIFPPGRLCPICQEEKSFKNGLGENCLKKISFIVAPICEKCGRPLRLAAAGRRRCTQCETTQYFFNQSRAVTLYDGALREYLAELKYRYRPELGEALGELLVEWIKINQVFGKIDLIVPVPIHHQKLMIRGYNQAELLANPLQRHLGIKLKSDIIIRHMLTESQNALHKEDRFANVNGAFQVKEAKEVLKANILLVDDILTTGATASEIARVLLKAGASRINVLTLAAGVMETEWLEKEKQDGHQEL